MEFETLTTERLILRKSTPEVYSFIFNNYTDDELKLFLGITTDDELNLEKNKFAGGYTTYRISFLFFHIIDKNTNQTIGGCGFHNWYAQHSRSEMGYHISSDDHKRKGFMTEAVKAVIDYGFNNMGLNRIEAIISPNNIASLKTIEKFNFKKEGYLKEHYFSNGVLEDSLIFGLLKSEYQQQL